MASTAAGVAADCQCPKSHMTAKTEQQPGKQTESTAGYQLAHPQAIAPKGITQLSMATGDGEQHTHTHVTAGEQLAYATANQCPAHMTLNTKPH